MSKFKAPVLVIPSDIYKKIMFWVDESDFECSWLGTIDYDKDKNIYYVVDVFLLDQENGKTSTDIKPEAISKLLYEERDNPFDIKWWGHSHVQMDVFWSNTDIEAMETLSDEGWFISTVFNQDRKMRTALTMLKPLNLMIDNIKTVIEDFVSEAERVKWKKEFNEKVKKKEYSKQTYFSYKNGNLSIISDNAKDNKYDFYLSKKKEESEKKEISKSDPFYSSKSDYDLTESEKEFLEELSRQYEANKED